jgi:hypothetical protein
MTLNEIDLKQTNQYQPLVIPALAWDVDSQVKRLVIIPAMEGIGWGVKSQVIDHLTSPKLDVSSEP